MVKKLLPFVFIFFLSLPIIFKLLQFEVNGTVDGWAHLFRQVLFNQALADGQFPPRWAGGANFGFGAPIFLFYWSLPYYLVNLFMKMGIPLVPGADIFLSVCTVFSGVFFYIFLKNYFDRYTSFIGAVLYLYSPYRLIITFLYESWGEVLALTIGPLLLYWVTLIERRKTRVNILIGGIISFLLVISHNGLALIFFAMAITLILLSGKVANVKASFLGLFGGFVASCFFWIPTVLESNKLYISLLATSLSRSPNYISIPNMIKVGIENLLGVPAYYTSFTPGILIMLFGVLGMLGILRKKIIILWAGVWFALSFILLAYQFDFLWENIYLLKMLMYPYRILTVMTVSGIFLTVYFLSRIGQYRYLFAFIIPVAIWAGLPYVNPKIDSAKIDSSYFYRDQPPYFAPGNYTLMGGEDYLPKNVPREYLRSLQEKGKPLGFFEGKNATLTGAVKRNSWKASFEVRTTSDTLGAVNIFYFQGWRGIINGREAALNMDKNGRITFPLEKGDSRIELEFGDTLPRLLAKAVSFFGAVLFLGTVFLAKRLKIAEK